MMSLLASYLHPLLHDLSPRPTGIAERQLHVIRETNTTPFDKGAPHAAFLDLLKKAEGAGEGENRTKEEVMVGDLLRGLKGGKGLVPGCGRVCVH